MAIADALYGALRGCTAKSAFDSEFSAKEIIRKRIAKGRYKDENIAPYHCRFCGFWHIGRSA